MVRAIPSLIAVSDTSQLLIMSPLTSMRWRQGQLHLSSPRHPRTFVVSEDTATLLVKLFEPREFSWILGQAYGISKTDLRNTISILIEFEIIVVVNPTLNNASNQILKWWDPSDIGRYDALNNQILQIIYGFVRSVKENFPVDHWGRPLPWLARPIIEFLFQYDLSQLSIFEFGGGASTLFWDRNCASVVTAESDKTWAERLSKGVGEKSFILYRPELEAFANAILESEKTYDIILIDAAPTFRLSCINPALRRLSPSGMIILDDAPLYPDGARMLRDADLIEVDFTGFTALETNLQTTSLFLTRGFNLPRRGTNSPKSPFGSPGFDWSIFVRE